MESMSRVDKSDAKTEILLYWYKVRNPAQSARITFSFLSLAWATLFGVRY